MKKNEGLIISAIAINNIGNIIFDLFIAWGLSSVTDEFMNAVYVIGTSVAFRAVLSFFMGAFVDKHSKKNLMIISHISSIFVITFFGLFWELAKQAVAIGIIFVLLNDINNEMFSRSYISMTADMFDKNHYIKFQSYSNIVVRIVSIGGAALAGILIEKLPNYSIFIIDILTYLVSMLLILKVRCDENAHDNSVKNSVLKNIIADVKYTFSNIIRSPFLSSFIILMFTLNLAYGYIPQILPVFKANIIGSATLLGMIKSSLTIGEIVGLALVSKLSRFVSCTFKVSMLANIFIIAIICSTQNSYLLIALFALYGVSDSLTQPLFGYTVSNLDSQNRGKLLGGIDAIIMFSPSIGIYAISALSNFSEILGGITVAVIFLIGFLIICFNKNMRHIVLDSKK